MSNRRVLTTALIAALGGMLIDACGPFPSSAPPAPPPKLAFDTTTHDAGVLDLGAKPAHTYAFRNVGALPLTIENLRASCGCTAVMSGARTLVPNTAGAITVECEPETNGGPQSHTVTVYSNDPAEPVRTMTLMDRRDVGLDATPPRLYVGHLQRAQSSLNTIHLGGNGVSQVGTIQVSGKSIAAGRSDEGGTHLRISAKPDAPLGVFTDRIIVYSRSTQQQMLSIPVSGIIDGTVTISPAQMHFGTVTPRARTARVVGIEAHGQQPLHISAVHLTPDIGAVAVSAVREGAEYRVTVTLGEGLRPGKISAVLDIDTDNPEQPHMQVPCIGRVVEKS